MKGASFQSVCVCQVRLHESLVFAMPNIRAQCYVYTSAVECRSPLHRLSLLQEPTIEPDTTAQVEMYLITFSSPSRTDTITVPASETSVVLTGLDMGTDYSITVVGINSAGPGASDSDDVATNIDRESAS